MSAILIHPTTASNPQAIADLERDTGMVAVIGDVAAELVRSDVVFVDSDDLTAFGDALNEAICRGAP